MPESAYWAALARFPKFGAKRLLILANGFPTMQEAFGAATYELVSAGIPENIALEFAEERKSISPEEEFERAEKQNIKIITFKDASYPNALKTIYDPPAILFVRGTLFDPNATFFSIVGTRKITRYGEGVAKMLTEELTRAGMIIVSGLAFGVDAVVHKTTLKTGGATVAVLPGGVDDDSISPRFHFDLAREIIRNGGALVSEYPIGTESFKQNFHLRNRIIAGLSVGTLVVEAAEKSGALITASAALEQGREVFAVPGPITSPASYGPNNLLKMGAHPVTCAPDILAVLGLESQTAQQSLPPPEPETEEAAEILRQLRDEPIHANEIAKALNWEINVVASTLTLMEIQGIVEHVGGMHYIKKT